MCRSISKETKRIAIKRTKHCSNCNSKIRVGSPFFQKYTTTFSDDSINKFVENICIKCNYKNTKRKIRVDRRLDMAKNNQCLKSKIELFSWSDGSLYGGNCQYQCHQCNLFCSFGDIKSF